MASPRHTPCEPAVADSRTHSNGKSQATISAGNVPLVSKLAEHACPSPTLRTGTHFDNDGLEVEDCERHVAFTGQPWSGHASPMATGRTHVPQRDPSCVTSAFVLQTPLAHW